LLFIFYYFVVYTDNSFVIPDGTTIKCAGGSHAKYS
jgi:hypothetical protein